ncbi:hypothetical protein F2Q68_00008039 [Brassica cretica]|uniref:Uncharacterized protein n=1 Tax=Brassica cretica TaxID=69181 RepID=A0A8S9KTP9_BRACR|nr:hypothetical protein F2Q68_00008039 [Brassica cretica]
MVSGRSTGNPETSRKEVRTRRISRGKRRSLDMAGSAMALSQRRETLERQAEEHGEMSLQSWGVGEIFQ